MEESADENISTYKHHDALQAMEKPFYDILGKAYPSSPKQTMINSGRQSDFHDDINNNYHDLECSGNSVSDLLGPKGVCLIDIDGGSELCNVALQFNRTAEEAKKLVPSIENLVVGPGSNGLSSSKQTIESTTGHCSKHTNKIRSHPHVDLELVEGRNSKHSAISTGEIIWDEIVDRVLLCNGQYHCDVAHLREMKAKEANITLQYVRNTGPAQGKEKSQGKKQEKEEVDLRALLIQCAQAISSNNHPFASELLKKIRHHSSPYGDGSQRLAIYFQMLLRHVRLGLGVKCIRS